MLEIRVYGNPAPQGSKRFMGIRGGKGILVESSKAVKPWRQAVTFAAVASMESAGLNARHSGAAITGAVSLDLVFTMPKPKSAPKRTVTMPDKKPDIDKLCRATMDALTDSGAIEDDARVVRLHALKVFPGEGTDSLPVPGVFIRISPA